MRRLSSSVVGVVLAKELVDGLRDWRSLASAFLFPAIGPLLVWVILLFVADTARPVGHVELAARGSARAPELVSWLASHDVQVRPLEAAPREVVEAGDENPVLVVPEDFRERFAAGRSAPVELVVDTSRTKDRPRIRHVRRLIEGFGQQVATLRLVARGVSPELAAPLPVRTIETASDQKRAADILNMIPMFVLLAAFVCGMQVAVDATAGERERGSLEPLLLNPVPRDALVTGKWLAASAFAAVGVALTLAGCMAVVAAVPLDQLGLRIHLGAEAVIGLFAATLPMAFLAPALQVLVASFARSFKEAQTTLSLLILVPALGSTVFRLFPVDSAPWMAPIPALGQQMLLQDVVSGESPSLLAYGAAGASSLVLALLCVALTARLFRRERIIYGR